MNSTFQASSYVVSKRLLKVWCCAGSKGDGAKGLLAMRKAGARTIGQDESTCVVYGMPKVAYDLGAVEHQEKLSDIAGRTYALLNKMR